MKYAFKIPKPHEHYISRGGGCFCNHLYWWYFGIFQDGRRTCTAPWSGAKEA